MTKKELMEKINKGRDDFKALLSEVAEDPSVQGNQEVMIRLSASEAQYNLAFQTAEQALAVIDE